MFLYKVEIVTVENESFAAIVLAESDEKAFSYAESQFRRQLLTPPAIKEISVVEKKYVEKGKGYILETR
ncbi:DUF3906 family protein [Brevibacillus fluminis]|uniref:DUF3906 family protein n=1 Tax=Brevibacillus fluminis TaxID=511487 RepID=A0A3M8DS93_9BACL|nr:DUF3906 family protein [Brevibacillus fluminis]RNB90321.1 DUF3906 family protein [Brevibacillus fluminis]